jgi:large subunit ribosomal protein L23
MRPATDIILGVRQTEKAARLSRHDQYVLRVAMDATKPEIRWAAAQLFGVTVRRVNTAAMHGKWRRVQVRWGRRPDWKKAVVSVGKGPKIEVKAEAPA